MTEEEKAKRKAFYQANKERLLRNQRAYYETHKEERNTYNKQYYQEHKERISQNKRALIAKNREKYLNYYNEYNHSGKRDAYNSSQEGRARSLARNYRHDDRVANRGESTLTPDWIIANVFNKKCLYCGETDWHRLGTDRIDNDKPHTPENCVCCCKKCNSKRNKKPFLDFALRRIGAKESEGLVIQY